MRDIYHDDKDIIIDINKRIEHHTYYYQTIITIDKSIIAISKYSSFGFIAALDGSKIIVLGDDKYRIDFAKHHPERQMVITINQFVDGIDIWFRDFRQNLDKVIHLYGVLMNPYIKYAISPVKLR